MILQSLLVYILSSIKDEYIDTASGLCIESGYRGFLGIGPVVATDNALPSFCCFFLLAVNSG
jgi:hypothetical protein